MVVSTTCTGRLREISRARAYACVRAAAQKNSPMPPSPAIHQKSSIKAFDTPLSTHLRAPRLEFQVPRPESRHVPFAVDANIASKLCKHNPVSSSNPPSRSPRVGLCRAHARDRNAAVIFTYRERCRPSWEIGDRSTCRAPCCPQHSRNRQCCTRASPAWSQRTGRCSPTPRRMRQPPPLRAGWQRRAGSMLQWESCWTAHPASL